MGFSLHNELVLSLPVNNVMRHYFLHTVGLFGGAGWRTASLVLLQLKVH